MTRYRSSTQVPSEALGKFKRRAEKLRIGTLSLAKQLISLAEESSELPRKAPDHTGGTMSTFPFVLPQELVDEWGGEERARELLRWAIMEGLDKSPLAAPEE